MQLRNKKLVRAGIRAQVSSATTKGTNHYTTRTSHLPYLPAFLKPTYESHSTSTRTSAFKVKQ